MTIPDNTPDSIMIRVKSGTIQKIGYVENTDTLIIQFGSGTYIYDNVPAELHQKLMAADSKGRFFAAHIKGKFATTKIPNPAVRENKNPQPVIPAA